MPILMASGLVSWASLIDQVFGESKLELKFIVDEGEAFLNECFQSIVVSKQLIEISKPP